MDKIIVTDEDGRFIVFQKDMTCGIAWKYLQELYEHKGIISVQIDREADK